MYIQIFPQQINARATTKSVIVSVVSVLSPRHSVTVAGTLPRLWARLEHSVSVINQVRQVILMLVSVTKHL